MFLNFNKNENGTKHELFVNSENYLIDQNKMELLGNQLLHDARIGCNNYTE